MGRWMPESPSANVVGELHRASTLPHARIGGAGADEESTYLRSPSSPALPTPPALAGPLPGTVPLDPPMLAGPILSALGSPQKFHRSAFPPF